MWKDCRLKYYYNYIGKWEGYKGDLKREKLQWLSKKTNWYYIKGQLVHQAIESQVAQHSLGRPVSKKVAKKLFRYRLGKIKDNPSDFLIEVINGADIGAEEFETIETEGLSLLDNFFEMMWPNYEAFRYEQHEKFERFPLEDINVFLRVDLVSKMKDGTVIVTDWKTGRLQELKEEQQKQLTVYLLWAMHRYDVPYDQVKAEVRPLPFPEKALIHQAGEKEIEAFRQFILEGARAMLGVDTEEDFPPSPDKDRCQRCNFATICPEGQEYLSEGRREEPILPGKIAAT